MDIGKRIINLREKKGWSQRELANRVGLNFSVMNRIEAGERPIRDSELLLIAQVLDVTSDYLLGSSVDSKRTIRGEEVDTSDLTENQRLVLDWAMQQEALSFHSQDELRTILDNLALIMEYEKARNEHNRNNKH